jgi:hypothetical protein
MRRIVRASLLRSLRSMFVPLFNNPDETKFIADAVADLVGEAHVDRNRILITGPEDLHMCSCWQSW